MVELGRYDEAVQFATAELELSQALIDRLLAEVGDPVPAALLLGKVNQAAERDAPTPTRPTSAGSPDSARWAARTGRDALRSVAAGRAGRPRTRYHWRDTRAG